MQNMTQENIIRIIKETAEKVPEWVAFYSLRDYKVPRVRSASIKIIRTCIALELIGLPITTNLLEVVLGDRNKLYTILHRLGDYKVIDNVESDNHTLVYQLNDEYKAHIKLPEITICTN